MASALLRLMALLAVLFMPVSMAAAPVAAQPVASSAKAHCEEQRQDRDETGSSKTQHCAACAALAAVGFPTAAASLQPILPLRMASTVWVRKAGPEADTPPPKLS